MPLGFVYLHCVREGLLGAVTEHNVPCYMLPSQMFSAAAAWRDTLAAAPSAPPAQRMQSFFQQSSIPGTISAQATVPRAHRRHVIIAILARRRAILAADRWHHGRQAAGRLPLARRACSGPTRSMRHFDAQKAPHQCRNTHLAAKQTSWQWGRAAAAAAQARGRPPPRWGTAAAAADRVVAQTGLLPYLAGGTPAEAPCQAAASPAAAWAGKAGASCRGTVNIAPCCTQHGMETVEGRTWGRAAAAQRE